MTDQKPNKFRGGWWPSRVVDSVVRLVLDDPEGPLDLFWRVSSLTIVTALMVFGLLMWRNPTGLNSLIGCRNTSMVKVLSNDGDRTDKVMKLLGDFLSFYKPRQLALVGWSNGVSVDLVWSNTPGAVFPTPVSGVLGIGMKEAVSNMIYDNCWVGKFRDSNDPDHWTACPVVGNDGIKGFVLMSWENLPDNRKTTAVKQLALHIGNLIF